MEGMNQDRGFSSEVRRAMQRFSIVGRSVLLEQAVERALKVAPIDLSVLVKGESGSGKEFFPKIIHQFGSRKHKKYIAVNCGAIPEGTIDSELFGHEKGSFTGAVSSRKGYFEEADGGTIFLDEVAELPLTTQARLLRVLETGEFLKVGSSQVQKTDIRVVAATNVDLLKAVRDGKFREDLYYRLSTIIIDVPNLHDRGSDVRLLARKFASDFSEKYLTQPITFSSEAQDYMEVYRWPGNVRQLKNVVEQLALFEAGSEISRETLAGTLPESGRVLTPVLREERITYEKERELLWQTIIRLQNEISGLRAEFGGERVSAGVDDDGGIGHRGGGLSDVRAIIRYEEPSGGVLDGRGDVGPLEESERGAIEAALVRNGGNRQKTADELGISSRTLYRKIKDLRIKV